MQNLNFFQLSPEIRHQGNDGENGMKAFHKAIHLVQRWSATSYTLKAQVTAALVQISIGQIYAFTETKKQRPQLL